MPSTCSFQSGSEVLNVLAPRGLMSEVAQRRAGHAAEHDTRAQEAAHFLHKFVSVASLQVRLADRCWRRGSCRHAAGSGLTVCEEAHRPLVLKTMIELSDFSTCCASSYKNPHWRYRAPVAAAVLKYVGWRELDGGGAEVHASLAAAQTQRKFNNQLN